MMKKMVNIDYEIGKGKIAEYTAKMEAIYTEMKDIISVYDTSVLNKEPELINFNYISALKFVRTWDIINSDALNQSQKNLLFCYGACDNDLGETLACFNGKGKGYKNKASLAVLISNIRKIIRLEYRKKYGNN